MAERGSISALTKMNRLNHLTSLWFSLRTSTPDTIRTRLAQSSHDYPEAQVIQVILDYRTGNITEVQAIRNIFDLLKGFIEAERWG